MMPVYEVTAPDGKTYEVTAPEGASKDQVLAYAKQQFAGSAEAPQKDDSMRAGPALGKVGSVLGNALAGAVRGAGSIGATILTPYDLLAGNTKSIGNPERRQAMDDALGNMGADPSSLTYKGGKILGEIAGTAGAGGALANGLVRMSPGLASTAPNVIEAIRTAGMTGGGMGARMLGGAVNGVASSAMVEPSANGAAAGGVIGGVMPPAVKVAGLGGRAIGAVASDVAGMFKSDQTRAAQELMKALDVAPQQLPALIQTLRGAETLVPGASPTVAQALSTPQASILSRVVHDSAGGEQLRQALVAQAEARMNALRGVAPVAPDGFPRMRADTGTAISRFANAERGQAATANSAQYQAVDPEGIGGVVLPAADMRGIANRYLGAGAVGENSMPQRFASEAETLSKPTGPVGPSMFGTGIPDMTRKSGWDEVLRMRSSLNEQWLKAKNAGDRQAASALDAQKRALDDAITKQLPPDMLGRWQEANASRAAIGQRFDSGPQAAIFQTRNGQPVKQGGEIADLFWGNRPGLAEDVQSFRKLIDDNPTILGQFRSMVTTDGADKAAQGGVLGQKFVDWSKNMLPGLQEIFDASEVNTIKNIAKDIERAAAASKLGSSPGGSNTYQNASNALDAGVFGSAGLKVLTSRAPLGLKHVLEPLRATVAESASKAKATRLAGLLSDAGAAADQLSSQAPSAPARAIRGLLDMGVDNWEAALPLLGVSPKDIAKAGLYRAPSLIGASAIQ